MPSKTTQSIITDLVRQTGGSTRFEQFAILARIALTKAMDHAPYYNFREERFQDLTGFVPAAPGDAQRYAIAARDVLPLPPVKQHVPVNLATYDHIQLYMPQFETLEPGVDIDGTPNPLVTTLNFGLPIPGRVGPTVQTITASGPLTAGTYTITWSGHTTGAINWNDSLTVINAALAAASIPYTAYSGPLTTPYPIGFISASPGSSATFTVTPSGITGGTLSVTVVQVGSMPAAPARIVRFSFRCRAILPASEIATIPLDDTYLDLAPTMFMHELLMTSSLGGDQTNHAYQAASIAKQLEVIKRVRNPVRVNNALWRGNSTTGGRVRRNI